MTDSEHDSALFLLEAERRKKQFGFFRVLQSAWEQMKVIVLLWILLLIGSIAILITGIVLCTTAEARVQRLEDNYHSQIDKFSSEGFVRMSNSSVKVQFPKHSGNSSIVSFPMDKITHKVTVTSDISYTDIYFFYNGTIGSEPFPPVQVPANPPFNSIFFGGLSFATEYLGAPKTFSWPVELLRVKKKLYSSTQAKNGPKKCSEARGIYDPQALTCFTFFKLNDVCIQMLLVGGLWQVNEQNPGCYYNFEDVGSYSQWDFKANDTLHFPNSTITLVSSQDPEVIFSGLTHGQTFQQIEKKDRITGLELVIFGIIGLVVAAVGWFLIWATQRWWKTSPFFLLQNRSREMVSEDSSVPMPESKSPLIKSALIWIFALVFFIAGAFIAGGYALLNHWSQEATLVWSAFIGLMMLIFAAPFATGSLWLFVSGIVSSRWPVWKKAIALVSVTISVFVLIILLLQFAVRPMKDIGTGPTDRDPLSNFWGWLMVLFLVPFAVTLCGIIYNLLFNHFSSTESQDIEMGERSPFATSRRSLPVSFDLAWTLFAILLLFPTIFFFSAIFPPLWNIPWYYYKGTTSEYSHLPETSIGSGIVPKLYTDTLIFWAYVYFIIFVGFLMNSTRPFRSFLHKRIRLPFGTFTTLGEILFISSWIALLAGWFYFWAFSYTRIAQESFWMRTGRVMGHIGNFFLASLMFPVHRNGIAVTTLGLSFDKTVQYHRWLGIGAFVTWTLHMLSWYMDWLRKGTLFYNIVSITNKPHADNWSIPMVEISWLGALVMFVLAQNWFRRNKFEWFFYSHHWYTVIIITSLIHAWTLWYYLAPPLILFVLDRMIRFWNGNKRFVVLSVEQATAGYTRLELEGPISYTAGQFAFINIPTISSFQWHPFSISSSPKSSNTLTFHIKDMGPETFTHRLAEIANSKWGDKIIVNVDGPYGHVPDPTRFHSVILVCGGIGVTPMISMLMALHAQAKTEDLGIDVYFIWTARTLNILQMFEQQLSEVARAPKLSSSSFTLSLSLSNPPTLNDYDFPAPITEGRVDLFSKFKEVREKVHVSDPVGVWACGPSGLIETASLAAYKHGFEYNEEIFEF